MTLTELRDKNLIIFEGIVGSRAYGLNEPDSDTDILGVYVSPQSNILGNNTETTFNEAGIEITPRGKCLRYKDDASKTDSIYFELRDFIRLLSEGAPQAIETLFLPKDCVLTMDEDFQKLIINRRQDFITSKLKLSFFYSPMRLLREHKVWRALPEKDDLDFFKVLPDGMGECMTLREFKRHAVLDYNAYALVEIPEVPDVFKAYVAYHDESRRLNGIEIDKDLAYPGIHVDDNGKVLTHKKDRGCPKEVASPLSFRKLFYFDRPMHTKYQALRRAALRHGIDPKNKDKDFRFAYDGRALAHCYRLIKYGIQLFTKKDLDLQFEFPLVYKDIKRNTATFAAVENLFSTSQSLAEQALNDNPLTTELSRDLLAEIEVTLRARVELTRTLQKSTLT